MRTLNRPTITSEETYRACISREDGEFRVRLDECIPDIIAAAQDFETKAQNTQLHLIPEAEVVRNVTVQEMKIIYDRRMAAKSGPGRAHYNALKLATADGICPLCNSRGVKTLDHHLAKAKHPALAVVPDNLVPACFDCNKVKTASNPADASEETLHPYFDNIEGETWLHAEVVQSTPPVIVFSVVPPVGADPLLASRVSHHFRIFELNDLYARNAARAIRQLKGLMQELFEAGGQDATKDHLSAAARSNRRVDKNSWETAMYQALSESAWYCSGGFN